MRVAAKFRKNPADRKRYVMDYLDWLDVGETVTSLTMAGDVEEDTFLIDGYVISQDGKEVIFYVSGGVSKRQYNVTVTIGTSADQIKQDSVTFVVN